MTLVVSVRVPDGVIVAADSLATLAVQTQVKAKGPAKCPKCGEEHMVEVDVPLPRGIGTLSTLPYALKLVPLWGRFAVATFGNSLIGERSVFALIQEFEQQDTFADPQEAAGALGERLLKVLGETIDVTALPDDSVVLGFHLSGHKDGKPVTAVSRIGKQINTNLFQGFGATVDGETSVVTHMWELKQSIPQMGATYQAWSVLDASDYAEFLISLTATSQRFGLMVPNVGGAIDVAVVVPQNKFRWIKRKKLANLLLEEERDHDIGEAGTADASEAGPD